MTDVSPGRARRAQAKLMAARLLCVAGVPALARWQNSERLAILMFHGVEGRPLSPPCEYVNDAATLRRELGYLRRHFHVLPLQEALERLRDGTLPRRAATVTFDDGTRNSFAFVPSIKLGSRWEAFAGVQILRGDRTDQNLVTTGASFSF